jgi:excisionase family DNA binding protein
MLLTIKDVSAWLNIKSSTLYLWVAQGKIPSRRIHSLIRFEKDMIERWLASFAQPSGPPGHTRRTASISDLDALIEAAQRDAYTPRHGETITPSPTGKE